MEFDWLEDFVALAELQHFSRAATARHLSQPAFSRRIRVLEQWVGAELVNRDTHRIELTDAGREFLPIAHDVLRRLKLGRDQVREAGRAGAAAVRFAATHTLSTVFFPAWLHGLVSQLDNGPISLVADHMTACEQLALEGGVDFLLCHTHAAETNKLDPEGFVSARLGTDLLCPVSTLTVDGAPRYRLPGERVTPLPHLEFDERSGMGRILRASGVIAKGGAALQTVFRSHLASALLAMAREGRGIAWVPMSLAQSELAAGRLALAGDNAWQVPLEIRLFRPRAALNVRAEALWRLVSSAA